MGPTTSEVPTATNRSQARRGPHARARGRRRRALCPKEIVAGFHGPPQAQRGTAVPASHASCATRARRARAAVDALDRGVGPVDGDHALGGEPAPLVQAVDVLRDQQVDAAVGGERGERLVPGFGGAVRMTCQVSPL